MSTSEQEIGTLGDDITVVEDTATAMSTIEAGQVDVQIATAKKYPRKLKEVLSKALEYATLDEETAESMFYVLPARGRDKKPIEGPSVRLAEVFASTWKNIRAETGILSTDEKFVTGYAIAMDMENNSAVKVQVRRRITNKQGNRYSDDMIQVTGQAAMSVAYRNAMWKVVPRAHVDKVYREAKRVAIGDAHTLVARRASAVQWFVSAGATEDDVFAVLDVEGIEEVTLQHLGTLSGLKTAIRTGELTVEQAFAEEAARGESAATAALNAKAQAEDPKKKAQKKKATKKKTTKKAAPTADPKPSNDNPLGV